MPNSILMLYGDVDFDGRAQRMIEIGQSLGKVFVIDAAMVSSSIPRGYEHHRVLLRPASGVGKRHLAFWRQAIAKARAWRPDLIFAEDFFTTFPGWMAARLTGARLVYDAHELIVPEPGLPMSRRSRVWYGLERFVAPRADLVIAANPERAEIMENHYRLRRTPTYMRNIPVQREVTAKQREAVLKTYPALRRRHDDDRILLYQGDVSLARGLGRFVEVLDRLPENYRITIVGDGPDLERLKTMAARHTKTGRFAALGRVANDTLPAITVHGDIGIVTYPHEGLNNIYCAPNKVFEYAQAGLAIIASDQPPLRKLFRKSNVNQTFSRNDDLDTLAQSIMKMAVQKRGLNRELENLLQLNNNQIETARILSCIQRL